jgi:hypothetical protein
MIIFDEWPIDNEEVKESEQSFLKSLPLRCSIRAELPTQI